MAIPSQVGNLNALFKIADFQFVSGYDPPRTLQPASVRAPPLTSKGPEATFLPSLPDHDQDPAAGQIGKQSAPAPASTPMVKSPKETGSPSSPQEPSHIRSAGDPSTPTASPDQPIDSPTGIHIDPNQNAGSRKGLDQGASRGEPTRPMQSGSGDHGKVNPIDDPGMPKDPQQSKDSANGHSSGNPEQFSPDQQGNQPGGSYLSDAFAWPKPSSPGSSPEQLTFPGDDVPPTLSNSIENNAPGLPVTTISVAGHAVAVGSSAVHVDGSQVEPQAAPVTIAGAAVINQGSSIVLGSQIYQFPSAQPASATSIAGHTVSPLANGAVVNSKTITAGASAATVSGTPVLVDSSHQIHFGDSSYQLPTPGPPSSTSLLNGAPAVILPNAVSVHGTTLSAGSPTATILGTVISLDSSNNLIYGATAVAFPSMIRSSPIDSGPSIGQVTTINAHPIVPLTQGISIAGTTLTPGAPPITVSNTPVSFGSSTLKIGASSIAFGPQAAPSLLNSPVAEKSTVIEGHPVVPLTEGISIAGTTLTPGASPITVSNTPISLGSSVLVIGTSSASLATPTPTAAPLIATIAGQVVTADANINLSGIPVSLDSSGELMIGSSTIALGSSSNTLHDPKSSGFMTGIPSVVTSSLPLQAGSSITTASAVSSRTASPIAKAAANYKSGLLDLRWTRIMIFVMTAIFAMMGL